MNQQTDDLSWRQRLGDGLVALAEAEAPTRTVTVADVIEAGRLHIRRRRRRTAFALSAVLVAGTALSFGALALANRGGGAPPADGDPTTAATSSIGTGSDLAAPIVAFGWLPASFSGAYEVQQYATDEALFGLIKQRGTVGMVLRVIPMQIRTSGGGT